MNKRRIILTLAVIFTAGQYAVSQQPTLAPTPYTATGGQPVVVGPPYVEQQQMIQPGAAPTAIYPPQQGLIPLPSQTPGAIFGPPAGSAAAGQPMTSLPPGAIVEPLPPPPGGAPVSMGPPIVGGPPVVNAVPAPGGPPNPILVPVVDENMAWDQIADVVDDYFKIAREQRVRRTGDAWTEGRIETAPLDGATVLQPFRKDSVGWFSRWESTFQSIRRRATVRVIPDPNGYLVEVIVMKELEDLAKPEKGTVGPYNSELTLPSKRVDEYVRTHPSQRWIQLGRDPALEQRMLGDIHARLNGITVSHSIFSE